jgi:predicted CoA-binding protein
MDRIQMKEMLTNARTIAVVGLSDNPDRASYGVAAYLQRAGYRIIPVNPVLKGPVLGEQPVASLRDIKEPIDIVDIFRRSEDVPPVVEEAIAVGARAVWLQLGIVNDEAAAAAQAAGLDVVQDKCIKVEHAVLGI